MIILDLCCGAGGAARGYVDAGHEVWGVDNVPRLRGDYLKSGATKFWVRDVLEFLAGPVVHAVDFIHASPPCQRYSQMSRSRPGVAEQYPDLIPPVRELLIASGKPFVIENVPGAPLRDPVILCGVMFGYPMYRPRWFECGGGFTFTAPKPPADAPGRISKRCGCGWPHPARVMRAGRSTVATMAEGYFVSPAGNETKEPSERAMAIDWMSKREDRAEAIPPYFTRWIGEQITSGGGQRGGPGMTGQPCGQCGTLLDPDGTCGCTGNVSTLPPLSLNGRADMPSKATTDIPGKSLAAVHEGYLRWFGEDYDLGTLNCVLAAAAAEYLDGDPPWLLVVGGSGAAKTETLMPLTGAGALVVSTISGEAALMSATPQKERADDATGGLLGELGDRGLLVIKDVTSILSMNRDTRALVLAALREIYDGHWSRNVGAEGGRTLRWSGRIVVVGACTTAWDRAHQVISVMGDRFALVRLSSEEHRRAAGLQAMRNVNHEKQMRGELRTLVAALMGEAQNGPAGDLGDHELDQLLGLADLVTRGRTPVERDQQGNPAFAHDPEMPTRYAKQLVQLARGSLLLGMTLPQAMTVAARCAADTLPPLRLRMLGDVAAHPDTPTADVVKRLQLPRMTVDRGLQELHLLGLLVVDELDLGGRARWIYSLADEVSRDDLGTLTRNVRGGLGTLTRNVSRGLR